MAPSLLDILARVEHLEAEVRHLKPSYAHRVTGKVKWYNVINGFGFITRDDNGEDVFVHRRRILRNNPLKLKPSVGDGEAVEFNIVLVPGRTPEAIDVTGPGGAPVIGSQFAPDKPTYLEVVPSSARAETVKTDSNHDGSYDGDSNGDDSNDFPASDASNSSPSSCSESTASSPELHVISCVNVPVPTRATTTRPICVRQSVTATFECVPTPSVSLTAEEEINMSDAWDALESLNTDHCCPHLHIRILSFLLMCHLEDLGPRCPSPRMLRVLTALSSDLIRSDPHRHLMPHISAFQRILSKFTEMRRAHREHPSDYTHPQRECVDVNDVSEHIRRLLEDVDSEDATNVNAFVMFSKLSETPDKHDNLQRCGHLLDQLVKMFYLSRQQSMMRTTLYRCYIRWELYYSLVSAGQVTQTIV